MSQPSPAAAAPVATHLTWSQFRRWAWRRLLILAVLLALYVLSIGPMWWAWYSGMYVDTETNYWIIALYAPLHQACGIEWVNSILAAYIEWWNL